MKAVLIISFVWIALLANGMSSKALFEKMKHAYNETNYSFSTSSNHFVKGEKIVSQSYDGKTIMLNGELYKKEGQSELILTKEYTLRVIHSNKWISIAKPNKSELNGFDINALTLFSEDITITEMEEGYRVEISYKRGSYSEYSKVEFLVDKDSYLMKEMTLYGKLIQSDSSSKEAPKYDSRTQLVFSNIDTSPKNTSERLKLSNYVSFSEGQTILNNKYSDYTVFDNRR